MRLGGKIMFLVYKKFFVYNCFGDVRRGCKKGKYIFITKNGDGVAS
jgi:hypothetical protein